MKNLNCRNCAGTMVIDASAMTAVCHYCGSKYVLDHKDTDYFRDFYLQMSRFFAGSDEERERKLRADALWEKANEQSFYCTDGRTIEIKYLHKYSEKDADVYVARRNIIFHFKSDGEVKADKFRRTTSFLDYPSADTRKLSDFFPSVTGGFELTDGTNILVISKDEDEYPLRIFGNLSGRHTAWIISRMENICCVLEYNGLVHPDINIDTLYINPYTHQACLYGNWWKAGKKNSLDQSGRNILNTRQNLNAIRETAAKLLGFGSASNVEKNSDIPEALAAFIKSEPQINAYDDFAFWDNMLIKAYGERKFVKIDTDDEKVYGGKR